MRSDIYEVNYYTLKDLGVTAESLATAFGTGKYAQDIAKAVYSQYLYNWAAFIDPDLANDTIEGAKERVVHKLVNRFQLTQDRYTVLLDSYAETKEKLLTGLKSESFSTFNDTPQGSGDFTDDQHVTNYTKTTNSTDFEPIMAKLERVQTKYRSLMADWVREFRTLFGGEVYD